jgi:antirestriction protein ArdC
MTAIYETVTNQIIAELEAGAIPWTQPWKNQRRGGIMPLNAATGRPYSGVNIPILLDRIQHLMPSSDGGDDFVGVGGPVEGRRS